MGKVSGPPSSFIIYVYVRTRLHVLFHSVVEIQEIICGHVCCVSCGRIRRTHSGGLPADSVDSNDFKRGGVRSTAGPRLAGVANRGSGR